MACRRLAWNLPRLLAAQSRVGVPCVPQWGATVAVQPRRALSLHEHQNMEILKEFGLDVPRGEVAETVEETRAITDRFGDQSVVKEQVLAGGRGKGKFTSGLEGGVQKAESPEEAASFAEQMLGSKLITKQTGNKGKPCNKVLLMELLHPLIGCEYYVAIVMDRVARGPVLMVSQEGGVDIEEVAARSPGATTKEYVDPLEGLTKEKAAQVVSFLGLSGSYHEQAVDQLMKLYRVFTDKDAIMVEINPMTRDSSGKFICMDAKINFDDNAAYCHPSIHELRDWTQEDHREVEATKAGLNYIGLDGDIGCLGEGNHESGDVHAYTHTHTHTQHTHTLHNTHTHTKHTHTPYTTHTYTLHNTHTHTHTHTQTTTTTTRKEKCQGSADISRVVNCFRSHTVF